MNRLSSLRRPCPSAALLLFLAVLPGAALAQKPAPAAPPAVSRKTMLDRDSRLDRPVTLDLISVPLGEVLQQESLDKSTDKMEDGHRFLLTAAPDCADLKLQVRLNNRPLRTLMTALAEMVPGVWERTPHGYQLSMTKQAADARTEWWRLFLGEREKALVRQRQLVLAAMGARAHRRKDSDPDPEQSDRTVEAEVADQHDFFHSLPEPLKEQVAAGVNFDDFYQLEDQGFGSQGERSGTLAWLSQMSADTQERFKAALQNNVNRLAQAPPAYAGFAVKAQKDLTTFDPSRVYFLFQSGGYGVSATPYNCPPSVSSEVSLDAPMWPTYLNMLPVYLNHAGLVDSVRRKELVPPEEWKTLIAYHTSRVWPNALPKLPPEPHRGFNDLPPLISRAAQTDWLGAQGHLEYVCDYYSKDGYDMPPDQKKLPVKRPLATELDEMAARRDISWTKDADGVTLIRNNRWYRDDGLEVPEPLLRRWFAAVLETRKQEAARQKAGVQAAPQPPEEREATLKRNWDWAAEVFSTLTPWQIYNGLALFQPEERDLAVQNIASTADLYGKSHPYVPSHIALFPGYNGMMKPEIRRPPFYDAINAIKQLAHTAQLYGTLDDTGRTALLEGRLPATALNTSQLAQAASLQPFLPQAMQAGPVASVFLGMFPDVWDQKRAVYGEFFPLYLDLAAPPVP